MACLPGSLLISPAEAPRQLLPAVRAQGSRAVRHACPVARATAEEHDTQWCTTISTWPMRLTRQHLLNTNHRISRHHKLKTTQKGAFFSVIFLQLRLDSSQREKIHLQHAWKNQAMPCAPCYAPCHAAAHSMHFANDMHVSTSAHRRHSSA